MVQKKSWLKNILIVNMITAFLLGGFLGSIYIQSNCLSIFSPLEIHLNAVPLNRQLLGSGSWTNRRPTPSPQPRGYHALAYDTEHDVSILYGGRGSDSIFFQDTWAYNENTNTWQNRSPTNSPPELHAHAMAFDSENEVIILFGGDSPSSLGCSETWVYDYGTNTWINRTTPTAPPPRTGHAMVYDAQSERIILFGGQFWNTTFQYAYDDTWAYDYNTNQWTNVTPSIGPSERMFYGMSYDAISDRAILFGGFSGGTGMIRTGFKGDTWAFDFETANWTELNPLQAPAARAYTKMIFHTVLGYSILYGGWNQETDRLYSDTWAYDYTTNTWTELDCAPRPNIRLRHQMVYDSESLQIVLYSGAYSTFDYQDGTWTFSFTPILQVPPPPWFLILAVIIIIVIIIVVILLLRRRKQ